MASFKGKKESGGEQTGKREAEQGRSDVEKNERKQEKRRDMMIFVNQTNAMQSKCSVRDGTEASAIQQAKPSFLRSSLESSSL